MSTFPRNYRLEPKRHNVIKVTYSNAMVSCRSLSQAFPTDRIRIPWDATYSTSRDMATAALERIGMRIVGSCEGPNEYYLISTTMEPMQELLAKSKAKAKAPTTRRK
jgi:hypothetical protein